MKQLKMYGMVFVLFLLLTACGAGGGGGGGGGSDTPADINPANVEQISGEVLGMLGIDLDLAFIDEFLTDLLGETGTITGAGIGTAAFHDGLCSEGAIDIDNYDPEVGETVTVTFTNCNDAGAIINGQISIMIASLEGVLGSSSYSFSTSITINLEINDGFGGGTINGDFTIEIDADAVSHTISFFGSSLSVTDGEEGTTALSNFSYSLTVNRDTGAYTASANGRLSSPEIDGGYVDFETTTPFEGVQPNNPESGVMKITGANNSSVTITAIGENMVMLALDADGDGAVDSGYPISVPWSN